VSTICGFLDRASLQDEVVAFAACILDALSYRFAATWRDSLRPSDYARDLQRFLKTDSIHHTPVSPDVVVLTALSLAHGFFTDRIRSSRHWALRESDDQFTVQEIEATKRAILQDMDYGLCRINNDMVQHMLRDMERAKVVPTPTCPDTAVATKPLRRRNFSIDLPGTAVWQFGVQTSNDIAMHLVFGRGLRLRRKSSSFAALTIPILFRRFLLSSIRSAKRSRGV
jgi:hypothetical protein